MEDRDIWAAAQKILELYPEGAEMAAAQRADAAIAAGDPFNEKLWTRVLAAVRELQRQKPTASEQVN